MVLADRKFTTREGFQMGKHHPKITGDQSFIDEFWPVIKKVEALSGVRSIRALRKTIKETLFIDKAVSINHIDGPMIVILLVAPNCYQEVIVKTKDPGELQDHIPKLNQLMINKPAFSRTP